MSASKSSYVARAGSNLSLRPPSKRDETIQPLNDSAQGIGYRLRGGGDGLVPAGNVEPRRGVRRQGLQEGRPGWCHGKLFFVYSRGRFGCGGADGGAAVPAAANPLAAVACEVALLLVVVVGVAVVVVAVAVPRL